MTASVTLRGDLRCPHDGLVIGADHVTVNLNGHTISGSGPGTGVSAANYTDFTIRNGTVVNFADHSVWVTSLMQVGVENVRLDSLDGAGIAEIHMRGGRIQRGSGIFAYRDLTFDGVRISGRIGAFRGPVSILNSDLANASVSIIEGNNSRLDNNTFKNSQISNSENDSVWYTRNRFVDSSITFEVSSNTVIRSNSFRGADIAIGGRIEPGLTIEDNVFQDNGIGVLVAFMPREPVPSLIRGNKFIGNRTAGVLVTDVRNSVLTISDNLFRGNGRQAGPGVPGAPVVNDGLHINAPPTAQVIVARNRTERNADYGIEVVAGAVTDGGGNTSARDPRGCLGVRCVR